MRKSSSKSLETNTNALPSSDNDISSTDMSEAGLVAFFSISEEWGLTTDHQRTLLGQPKKTSFFKWKKDKKVELSKDTLERLSYIVGIYKATRLLFPAPIALEWINNRNKEPLFKGLSPLEYMLKGQVVNLSDVRRYLDWARG